MIVKPQSDRFANFTVYPNCFTQDGDSVTLHEHKHDHLAVMPGGWVWRIIRMPPGEPVRDETFDIAPGGLLHIGIPAPWKHDIIRVRRSELPPIENPTQFCLFADYDRNGHFLPNPQVSP